MRKLLNTLFVLSEDAYLSLDGENIVVNRGEEITRRFPLHTLESILCFGYKGASPALMGACAQRCIALSFFTPRGRFLCRTTGQTRGNVLLRREQYRWADDGEKSLRLAQTFITGKIYNGRWVLERAKRDHALRIDVEKVASASSWMVQSCKDIVTCVDMQALRGVEGLAAVRYFAALDELILQNKEQYFFHGRSRRPPMDRVNAMLSFVYTLLAHDCAAALEGVGLDAYVGFFHRDRPGRISLALDLMEELRPILGERFVLTLINRRSVGPAQFEQRENGAVLLNDSGRQTVLSAWQERKREMLMHPFLKEKISWGLVPYVQALLLSRCLRGELDGYPPFFWK